MAEYIDKQAFLEKMKKTDRYFTVKFDIENFPIAEVEPVRHGWWERYSTTMQECSECHRHTARHRFEYCPHCGTRMDGGADNGEMAD